MYDFHSHSILSDGELVPSELARRYEAKGYQAIAITDHVDVSNIKVVVAAIVSFCRAWPKNRITVLPGIELTHLPLEHFKKLTTYARKNGIKVIVAHGQTICEPVIEGTNREALSSDIDILAHPGCISKEDVLLAKKRGIFLEITTRKGHRDTNKKVLSLARKIGAKLILNNDAHAPDDILIPDKRQAFAAVLGMRKAEIEELAANARFLISKNM